MTLLSAANPASLRARLHHLLSTFQSSPLRNVRSLGPAERTWRALAGAMLLALLVPGAWAADTTLAWDPVPSSAVAGYVISYGSSPGQYSEGIDVGNMTMGRVSNLVLGATYHFAVQAYDAAGARSGYSNDVAVTVGASSAAPVAGFWASTTSGAAPLALNFIDSSTGTVDRYLWSFGDGTTSTAQNPVKTYQSAGSYTVALTVSGPGGSNTLTRNGYIAVGGDAAGSILGDVTLRAVNANLTATGTLDWMLWPSQVRKAAGNALIGEISLESATAPSAYGGDSRQLTWTDGSPIAAGATTDGIEMAPHGTSWTFSLPADTRTRTVTVYAGGRASYGTLRAYLSDGSAPEFISGSVGSANRYDATFTIMYRAGSPGQTLKVIWAGDRSVEVDSIRTSAPGTLRLQGIALRD